jgi:transposase
MALSELIKLLDDKLQYIEHEFNGGTVTIRVEIVSDEAKCPYCEAASGKVHSRYNRRLQDLPIQGWKVKLIVRNKKYFCVNPECSQRTFAEPLSFCEPDARKTKRLQAEILRVSLTQSSVSAAEYLRRSVADVGKSAICDMLKKELGTH